LLTCVSVSIDLGLIMPGFLHLMDINLNFMVSWIKCVFADWVFKFEPFRDATNVELTQGEVKTTIDCIYGYCIIRI